ncbi:MAG: sigma-54-dependent Fis family transcriptional regulator [Bacteroidales bacterium]|nr:sigma-54-dependent Fis family transcriptional regulator [Bacteroidales bacterium]
MNVQQVKQRFGIIGNHPGLNRAIDTAIQVAHTDLSVLITGESGTGKEVFSQIIHQNSSRKHNQYIAVNCGAIPDGTIDSELFGHEKGAFTGAIDSRKGYFEVANTGTIFLDEVGELPLSTQVRLLRVLETGEYIKVGSSKVLKTDVRVVAATNVNLLKAIENGKFREDLYYRLNTVPIYIPPLRERVDDIPLLFKKFANDSAEKYRMPSFKLEETAIEVLSSYRWPGNIRQLKNIAEQIVVLEPQRDLNADIIQQYLPQAFSTKLPAIANNETDNKNYSSEREILFKLLFDMKNDMNELKKVVQTIVDKGTENINTTTDFSTLIQNMYDENPNVVARDFTINSKPDTFNITRNQRVDDDYIHDTHEIVEESLSLEEKEKELIIKALEKHTGKRKYAANELGISERTLYRKIKEYNIE